MKCCNMLALAMFGLRGPRRSRSSAACGVLGNRRSHRIHCEDCKTGVIGLQISRSLPWYLFHKILTPQMRRQSSRWAGEPGQRGAKSNGRHRRVTHKSKSSDYTYIFRIEDAARTGVRDFQNSHNRHNRSRVQLWLPRLQRPWHDACRTYVYASPTTAAQTAVFRNRASCLWQRRGAAGKSRQTGHTCMPEKFTSVQVGQARGADATRPVRRATNMQATNTCFKRRTVDAPPSAFGTKWFTGLPLLERCESLQDILNIHAHAPWQTALCSVQDATPPEIHLR